MMRALATLFLATVLPALPLAQSIEDIRPQEASRLARFDEIAGAALMEAMAGGTQDDVAALARAMSGTPGVAISEGLGGDWTCRTIKLGGIAPLTVYSPFECRFTWDGVGYRFEKLTGSQRTAGRVSLGNGRAVYLGVGYVADSVAPAYSDLEADFAGDGQIQPDVGVFQRVSDSRARILFPAPVNESLMDVLELTR